jgi:hypothetical protein
LNELVLAGHLEALDVREGNTKKVYYPIVSASQQVGSQTQKTEEYDKIPQFFSYRKINVPADYKPVPVKWLIFQILGLWKCGINYGNGQYDTSAIQFLDIEKDHLVIADPNESEGAGSSTITSDNTSNETVRRSGRNRITIRQFARKYNGPTGDLSRHFSRPIFANSHNKIFGDLHYIDIVNQINSGICQNSSLS